MSAALRDLLICSPPGRCSLTTTTFCSCHLMLNITAYRSYTVLCKSIFIQTAARYRKKQFKAKYYSGFIRSSSVNAIVH